MLCANGFGPTSRSLAACIELFEAGFEQTADTGTEALRCLRVAQGRPQLRRSLAHALYRPVGKQLIAARPGQRVMARWRTALYTAAP